MKIAIPICSNCVSNVFDFSAHLLVTDIEDDKGVNRKEVPLVSRSLSQRVEVLNSLNVEILICGAISRALADMVTVSGIELLPFVTGSVDDILNAYLTGKLENPEFTMPGYWPGARKDFGRCGQSRRGCRRQGKQK